MMIIIIEFVYHHMIVTSEELSLVGPVFSESPGKYKIWK